MGNRRTSGACTCPPLAAHLIGLATGARHQITSLIDLLVHQPRGEPEEGFDSAGIHAKTNAMIAYYHSFDATPRRQPGVSGSAFGRTVVGAAEFASFGGRLELRALSEFLVAFHDLIVAGQEHIVAVRVIKGEHKNSSACNSNDDKDDDASPCKYCNAGTLDSLIAALKVIAVAIDPEVPLLHPSVAYDTSLDPKDVYDLMRHKASYLSGRQRDHEQKHNVQWPHQSKTRSTANRHGHGLSVC